MPHQAPMDETWAIAERGLCHEPIQAGDGGDAWACTQLCTHGQHSSADEDTGLSMAWSVCRERQASMHIEFLHSIGISVFSTHHHLMGKVASASCDSNTTHSIAVISGTDLWKATLFGKCCSTTSNTYCLHCIIVVFWQQLIILCISEGSWNAWYISHHASSYMCITHFLNAQYTPSHTSLYVI